MKPLAPCRTPRHIHPPVRRIVETAILPAPTAARFRFKTPLWIGLGFTTLFVFFTSEVLLVADYPMYHAYRLQVISDRHLLLSLSLAASHHRHRALLRVAKLSLSGAICLLRPSGC